MAAIARLRVAATPLKAIRFLSNRAFGSAAAVQYHYDEEEEEEHYEQCMPRGMLDTEGSSPERGVQWVMIGEPGARRHLFAERLSKLLEVPHISMATLLRQELSPRSSLYQQIANALDHGKLVPEEIIFGLLTKRLEDGYSRGETGFILDGIPRTRIQAEILDHIVPVDLVVNFKCSEEDLVKKNLGTRKFTSCQEYIFMNSSWTPTKQLQDDHVRNHAEECKLLEDYYRKQKKLLNFEVAGAPGETWQGLLAALHLQHINALSSSQKLTA
ncbi:probable adenylate kinase 7, mitochondrial [Gastrolobium bilobum]|uniref:probable adenylate kinase 7, mitochondrial n=1 Tax=Gastrolobium bilobum TaxID=150636 RepID=UPI002AAF69FA|nr:probable adenylate kinase 7, mitochondrial [Gastrolobium bilobum]